MIKLRWALIGGAMILGLFLLSFIVVVKRAGHSGAPIQITTPAPKDITWSDQVMYCAMDTTHADVQGWWVVPSKVLAGMCHAQKEQPHDNSVIGKMVSPVIINGQQAIVQLPALNPPQE